MTDESGGSTPPPSREEEIARKAARLVKGSKPRLKRLIAFTRPRAEVAGKQAVKYAREHEDEIRDATLKLARTRLPGPLGMAVGALANGMTPEQRPAPAACSQCGSINPPAANFCNECGARLVRDTASS